MGSRKNRWKIFLRRSSLKSETKQPPKEFICPIYGSLMADPVIVSSGQTFERNCVIICQNLGFQPIISDGSTPDFSTVIPNFAIKSTIHNWCDNHGIEKPKPIDYFVADKFIRSIMASQEEKNPKNVEESVTTQSNQRPSRPSQTSHCYTSSEESVITTISTTLLPVSTQPARSSSSCSSSSEIETLNPNLSEDEIDEIVIKLRSSQVIDQEEAVISLRRITKTRVSIRVSICSSRLLSALRPLLISRYNLVQVNAVAALVNLSLEKINKVKIVRSGFIPLLIEVLKGGYAESQEHATSALFSLALDDENKTAIGVLGGLTPLLHMLRSGSERTRNDSLLALYHLSLVQSNRFKLVKLGAIPMLLTMAKSRDLGSKALLILCNLASCSEGRGAILDSNGVECFVRMLREKEMESELTRDHCVTILYALSYGSLRFKGLAKEAGAVEVLREIVERESGKRREKAKIILEMIRGRRRNDRGEVEIDWESMLD